MPDLESYSIEALVKHFDIANQYLHTASEDVEVLWNIIREVNSIKWFQLGEPTKTPHKSKCIKTRI